LRSVSAAGKDRVFVTAPELQKGGSRSFGTLVDEFVSMVVAYAKQETLDPVKALGRYVAFGIVGALLIGIGGGLLALAAIRAVQAETGRHVTGSLTYAPYFAGVIVAGVGAGWAVTRIMRGSADKRR
jgi:hypothetical protein